MNSWLVRVGRIIGFSAKENGAISEWDGVLAWVGTFLGTFGGILVGGILSETFWDGGMGYVRI